MERMPRYTPNVQKALEAILWITSRQEGFDVYHVVKAAFFADKQHVSTYGRPIVGDVYHAAPFGPLPQVVYGLLKAEPIEVLALSNNGSLPIRVDDAYRVFGQREANTRILSESDVKALDYGVNHVVGRTFGDIFEETHEDPAYVNAGESNMDYRLFVPQDDPHWEEKADFISESAKDSVI